MAEYKGLEKPGSVIRTLTKHKYRDLILICLVMLIFFVLIIASFT